MSVFGQSKAGRHEVPWTVDYITATEARKACHDLRAVEFRSLPLGTFTVFDAVEKQHRNYLSEKYHEAWIVEACGIRREWRILDDSSDRDGPHRALLLMTK